MTSLRTTANVRKLCTLLIPEQKLVTPRLSVCSTNQKPRGFMLQKQLNRHSSSLVHKLKRKFFPEEFTPVSPTSDKNTDASGDSDSPLARDYIPPKNVEQIYTLYQVSTRDVNAMSVIVIYF